MKTIIPVLILALVLPVGAPAQTAPPAAYQPGLGDLMTMAVQPRHTKLGIAGSTRNWAYAAYELGELREALDQVAEVTPVWDTFPVATNLHTLTAAPLEALDAAIKAADARRFIQAYRQLTRACNTCHLSAAKRMIVIQVPAAAAYPDQDFRPIRK
jgi:hypothetical protein